VLRRIFAPRREEATGGWGRLHNEELHNLYASPCIVREIKSERMRWTGYVARMGEIRNSYKTSVRKTGRTRPRERPEKDSILGK
jgi:hypothetical protein